MAVRLRITAGKGAGRAFVFSQRVVRIGRTPDNDLVLYDAGVSRYHCELVQEGEAYELRDQGSANGTLVNGVLTTEARLRHGDEIRIGPVVFEVSFETGGPVPHPPEDTDKGVLFAPDEDEQRRTLGANATSQLRAVAPPPELREPHRRGAAARPSPPAPSPVTQGAVAENRTDTGSFINRRGKRRLNVSTRVSLAVAAAVVTAAVAVSAILWFGGPPPDRSAELFRVDKQNATLSFGAGNVDVSTPDRASFAFSFAGGRAVLTYAAAGIDTADELEILVNGERVGYAAVTSQGWNTGLELVLPRRHLERGDNVITFDNTRIPGGAERWGISQVAVTETPLPTPDPAKAKQLYELGKAAFETRSVAPHNLYRSLEYYEQARDLVEAQEPPPPLLTEIEQALAASREALQNAFDSHLFAAEQALRFGERERAVDALRDVLRYFPNPEDPRYRRARDRLNELMRGSGR